MKITSLKPLEKNPFRSKGDQQIKRIADSIQSFEKMMTIRKIVIDENNSILGGNKRYFALKMLGYKDIPDDWIDKRTDLTEDEKREFIVKDNAHWGSEWDDEILQEWDVDREEWGIDSFSLGMNENEMNENDIDVNQEFDPIGLSKDIQRVMFIFDNEKKADEYLSKLGVDVSKRGQSWQVNLSTLYI